MSAREFERKPSLKHVIDQKGLADAAAPLYKHNAEFSGSIGPFEIMYLRFSSDDDAFHANFLQIAESLINYI